MRSLRGVVKSVMYKIGFTRRAKAEIEHTRDYISREFSEYNAEKVVNRIYHAIFSLRVFPERKRVATRKSKGVWIIHSGHYNILYLIDKRRHFITIIHILHAKQDYTRFLNLD